LASQKAFAQAGGQAARRFGRQDAEQSATGGYPAERALEDSKDEPPLDRPPCGEGRKRTVRGEVGAEQDARHQQARIGQGGLKASGRQVDDGNCAADQRQRCAEALAGVRVVGNGEVAGLTARSGTQLRQVDG
jgi:hypothetical protein